MVTLTSDQEIAILRLEHGKANAMDLEMLEALEARLDEFERGEARALVLTGAGTIFCAGVDLYRLLDGGDEYLDGFLAALHRTLLKVYRMPKPVVAALNGHAIAGGCLLAAACDHRLMADGKGKVGVTELYVGVPFPVLGLEILRAGLAPHVVDDLVLTGRLVGAAEAASLGLVHRVLPAEMLDAASREVARHLGSVVPETFAITKQQLRAPVLQFVERELVGFAARVAAQWREPEVRATIRAFLDATVSRSK